MKIAFIFMGNKMPHWVTDGVMEYKNRIDGFCDCSIHEIALKDRLNKSSLTQIQIKEAQEIRKHIPKNSYIIALMINGKQYTSEQYAAHLSRILSQNSNLCFIIGGPEGIHESIQIIANEKLSLSSFTLPHTLARIVLLETIYRVFAINNNLPYHK